MSSIFRMSSSSSNTNIRSFVHFTGKCLHYLYHYFRSSWPVSLVYGEHLREPSTQTETKLLQIIHLIKYGDSQDDDSIEKLLASLPTDEALLTVTDPQDGYNVLQHAIIERDKYTITALLKKGCLGHSMKCNTPLHLAAFLGNKSVLQLILDGTKQCDSLSGMCYPDPHHPVTQNKLFGLFNQIVYKCQEESLLAVEFAIKGDNVDCANVLLDEMKSLHPNNRCSPSSLLHFACQRGSTKSIKLLLSRYPEEVNSPTDEGDTPLLETVPWGKQCVRILLDSGADVNIVSNDGETALHRLYRCDIDGLFTILDTTTYLLTTGIEQLINSTNFKEETPLHVLVTHVSYIGGNFADPDRRTQPRSHLQPDYQHQVIESLNLLLRYNADPHVVNCYGLQPLNKLLHIALKTCNRADATFCVQNSIDSCYVYRNDFAYLKQALEVLLRYGANPRSECRLGHTPTILLLQCLLHTDIDDICEQSEDILDSVELLLKYGGNPDFVGENEVTCSTLLAKIACRYFSDHNEHSKQIFANFLNNLLVVLLKYGLNVNYASQKKRQHLMGGTGNALIEFVRLMVHSSATREFEAIHMWLKTLLQWGGNPDMEPYPSEPIICHSQSSIFLKKQGTQAVTHYIHGVKEFESLFADGHAQELLLLFYKTMDHKVLYECLNTARFMTRFHPLGATGKHFLSMLTSLTENPRSLKQMSRVVIYKSLDRQLARGVNKLPLPDPLKDYLLEVE